jgi:predicted metal-dependent hydrolase
MNIVKDAFGRLFPDKEFNFSVTVKYSAKFKSFNSNIKLRNHEITLNLSKDWKNIDDEIKIGLIQELLTKLFKEKQYTNNMEMYNSFIKKLHKFVPKTKTNEILELSFNRVNEKYFNGLLECPNLKFGQESFSKFGSYTYAQDLITISSALKHDLELIDYVMYHELLHKKYQYKTKNGKNYHHTRLFKKKEKEFANADLMEKRLGRIHLKKYSPFRFLKKKL